MLISQHIHSQGRCILTYYDEARFYLVNFQDTLSSESIGLENTSNFKLDLIKLA